LKFFRWILVFVAFASTVNSSPLDEKRLIVSKIGDNKYKMRIYFNYENPYETQRTLMGRITSYDTTVPIPDRFDVSRVFLEVKYTPSVILHQSRSTIAMQLNNHVIRQFKLNKEKFQDSGSVTITGDIPPKLLLDYNKIGVKIIQHYSSGTTPEDTAAPELWTQIDLQNSYVELTFKVKDFEEKISSIKKFILDQKNIFKDVLNFVYPKAPSDDDFFHYAFFAHFAGRTLKFRDLDFSISTKINDKRNNVIIALRKDLDKIFKGYKIPDFEKKISGNINIIQNPNRHDKGFVVITGDSEKEIKNTLFRLNDDIFLLDEQNLKIISMDVPPPSKPYSTPGFISPGNKVFFSDLGYKTKTFYGEQPEDIYLNFKLYPTVYYTDQDNIQSVIKTIQGAVFRGDSTTNVYLNNNLAYQYRTYKNINNDELSADKSMSQRFELGYINFIPSVLLKKGKNNMRIEFVMIPVGGPALVRFNNDILKITVRDDSYLVFPQAKTKIELPNLEYISDLAFPFSIYPDLRNTGILITDLDSRTIASAMYVAFFLGKQIDYPAYRLTVTPDINKMLYKDIITIGKQVERYSLLYKNAPIKFTKDGVIQEIALDSKYMNDGDKRVSRHTVTSKVIESIKFDDYLIVQTYQSPFNKKRIILEISANNPEVLFKGVRNGFSPLHLGKFKGDVWIYNVATNKSYSFRLQDTYILDHLIDDYNSVDSTESQE